MLAQTFQQKRFSWSEDQDSHSGHIRVVKFFRPAHKWETDRDGLLPFHRAWGRVQCDFHGVDLYLRAKPPPIQCASRTRIIVFQEGFGLGLNELSPVTLGCSERGYLRKTQRFRQFNAFVENTGNGSKLEKLIMHGQY